MRKRLILAALAAAAGVCLASCEKEGFEIQTPSIEVEGATVLHASFDEESTKTYLSMNDAGTHADVLWEAGDQIVLSYFSGNQYGHMTLTTQDGGTSEADFATSQYNFGELTPFVAVYPASRFYGFGNYNGLALPICIPTTQNAVAGGVERGMLQSSAYTEDISDGLLKFKNLYALLKFRLAGSSAGQVKRVRFSANVNIAGDGTYYPETQEFNMNVWFTTTYGGPQSFVELTGDFKAGVDYYIALAPGTSNGFSMQFFNSADEPITKISDKTLTLNRSRITDFGTITLNETFGGLPDGVEQYMTHTKGAKPVCIAVIAEAFKASEQDLFTARAKQAVDALFATEPYKTYRDYFNVYIMQAVSNDSGASKTDGNGNITEYHDTYFGSSWGADSYGDMSSNANKAFSFVSVRCPEVYRGEIPVEEVPVLMLINDTRYGGICWNWADGSCIGHVPYVYGGTSMGWGHPGTTASSEEPGASVISTPQSIYDECGSSIGDWRNVVIHEFGGHGFGRLNDEYWGGYTSATSETIGSHSWTVPMGLNVSGTYDAVPWQTEVLDELMTRRALCTDNPNPYDIYAARVGKFQGGDNCALGRWRSERISCMIDNRQYFSCWQRMLIVKRIMSLAGETFDLNAFYDKDVAIDPVRDKSGNAAPAWGRIPEKPQVTMCPPLPPPVLKETPGPLPLGL